MSDDVYNRDMEEINLQPIILEKTPRFFRLTEDEFKTISAIAESQGLRFSHYMRILAVREIARVKKEQQKEQQKEAA